MRNIIKISLAISIILHLLLFLTFAVRFVPSFVPEERPELDIPAYIYKPEIPLPQLSSQQKKRVDTSQNGLEKPEKAEQAANQNFSYATPSKAQENSEPVHLIGDKNVDKPFIKLLGKALARHLVYPKIASDFKITGTSLIGFTIYPDGRIEGVQLVQSSGADVLDEAALTAVAAMSPVQNVAQYLPTEKFLVVGIIFG